MNGCTTASKALVGHELYWRISIRRRYKAVGLPPPNSCYCKQSLATVAVPASLQVCNGGSGGLWVNKHFLRAQHPWPWGCQLLASPYSKRLQLGLPNDQRISHDSSFQKGFLGHQPCKYKVNTKKGQAFEGIYPPMFVRAADTRTAELLPWRWGVYPHLKLGLPF